jgi:hypothetical protein
VLSIEGRHVRTPAQVAHRGDAGVQPLARAAGVDLDPSVHRLGLRVEHLQSAAHAHAGVVGSAADDWSRSRPVVWVFSVAIVFLGLSAAVAGAGSSALGPRMVGVVAACCWGGGFIAGRRSASSAHQLWLLYLGYGVVGGVGLGLGYVSPVSTLIRWFPDRRGMATGMAIMGFGGGAMIAAPAAASGSSCAYYRAPEYLGAVADAVSNSSPTSGRRYGRARRRAARGGGGRQPRRHLRDDRARARGRVRGGHRGAAGVAATFFTLGARVLRGDARRRVLLSRAARGLATRRAGRPRTTTTAIAPMITRHPRRHRRGAQDPAVLSALDRAVLQRDRRHRRARRGQDDDDRHLRHHAARHLVDRGIRRDLRAHDQRVQHGRSLRLGEPLGRDRPQAYLHGVLRAWASRCTCSIPYTVRGRGHRRPCGALAGGVLRGRRCSSSRCTAGASPRSPPTSPTCSAPSSSVASTGGCSPRGAWPGVLGPSLHHHAARSALGARAIAELAAQVDPATLRGQAFGAGRRRARCALVAGTRSRLAKLMELAPAGTTDPTAFALQQRPCS